MTQPDPLRSPRRRQTRRPPTGGAPGVPRMGQRGRSRGPPARGVGEPRAMPLAAPGWAPSARARRVACPGGEQEPRELRDLSVGLSGRRGRTLWPRSLPPCPRYLAETAALAVTMVDWQVAGRAYAAQMMATAQRLAEDVAGLGAPVFAGTDGPNRSHQFALARHRWGRRAARRSAGPASWPLASGPVDADVNGLRLGTRHWSGWGWWSGHARAGRDHHGQVGRPGGCARRGRGGQRLPQAVLRDPLHGAATTDRRQPCGDELIGRPRERCCSDHGRARRRLPPGAPCQRSRRIGQENHTGAALRRWSSVSGTQSEVSTCPVERWIA